MKFLCAILLFVSAKCFAQYPFEKYPKLKYDSVLLKRIARTEKSNVFIANYKDYKIELLELPLKDSTNLLIYRKKKLIQKIKSDIFLYPYLDEMLYVADIDGNGLIDFKFTSGNVGASGLASSRIFKFYLFNKGGGRFTPVILGDFFSYKERQLLPGKGYAIIGQSLAEYKGHNYWLFDLYEYKNHKIVNVSKQYGYPIAVPFLYNETFKPTNKIPKKELKRLSLKVPDFCTVN
jgi:hypothetical protein